MQYDGCTEIDKYMQNPKSIQPTEFTTSTAHVPGVVNGKERSKELTGDVGPFVTVQKQSWSSSMSIVHPDQEVCAHLLLYAVHVAHMQCMCHHADTAYVLYSHSCASARWCLVRPLPAALMPSSRWAMAAP